MRTCNDVVVPHASQEAPVAESSAPSVETAQRSRRPGSIGQHVETLRALLAPLFPIAPAPKGGRRLALCLYPLAFVVLTVVALLRQAGVDATNSIWAEDGALFYRDALSIPGPSNLVQTYNGYVQLLPRLLFEGIRYVPVADAAFVISVTGAAFVAALGLVVFRSSAGFVHSRFIRGLLVAAIVLLPVAPGEVLNNVVNVQWWLIFASFWVLLWRPRSWPGRVTGGAVCFFAAASNPIMVLLLPVAGLRLVALRRRSEHVATAGLALGLVFQLGVVVTSHVSSAYQLGGSGQAFAKAFGVRVGLSLVAGVRGSDNLWSAHPLLSWTLGLGVFAVFAVLALAQRGRQLRLFIWLALGESVLLFVVPVFLRDAVGTLVAEPVEATSRWQVVPELLIISAILVAADVFSRRKRGAPWIIVLVVVILAPAWVVDFRMPNPRIDGPRWSHQVAVASRECQRHHRSQVALQISPPGWSMVLPCTAFTPSPSGDAARPAHYAHVP